MTKKMICFILVLICTFGISCTVHAEEEYDNEWNYTEDEYYDEYYYNENNEYYDETTDYYYEETPVEDVTEEFPAIEESVSETLSEVVQEEISIDETPSEVSQEEISIEETPSEVSQEEISVDETPSKVSQEEISIDEKSELSDILEMSEPRILNLAFTATKEVPKTNQISGTALWGIVFVLTVFSIVFLPRTRGIEFIKDRYRYRKAKKITKRHIK